MNKNCYRLIFNKARGIIMAVAEVVHTQGKHKDETRSSSSASSSSNTAESRFTLKLLVFNLWALCTLIPIQALAQIVVDNTAPTNQRPTVSQTANGVPMVNIQTPNQSGVSYNSYRQFDVNQNGAILNNSRNDVQTQLGGWVNGNPALANGGAQTILNEINSQNPSRLNGYLEVAGQQAHVIIANPSGITCNGCGFINANQATLTTGKPQFKNGALSSYIVQRGVINFEGQGLNSSAADYTNIIARSIEVNSGLWANQLRISAGAGEINAKDISTIKTASDSLDQPSYALDVSTLGGMYTQKIALIGTEHGLGVRNAGHIGAAAGHVKVSVNGLLENMGHITSDSNTDIVAQNLNNQGEIAANHNLTIQAANLNNQGQIQAQNTTHIATTELNNQANGRIYGNHIAIESQTLNNQATEGTAPVIAAQQRLDLGIKDSLLNANDALIYSLGDIHIAATLNDDLTANHDNHTANIINRSATIEAQNNLNISAQHISNLNDQLEYKIVLDEQKQIRDNLNSSNYRIYTQKTYKPEITLTKPGKLIAGNDITINASKTALNMDSHILAGNNLIFSGQALTNQQTLVDTYTTRSGTHYTKKSYKDCWSKTFGISCRTKYRWVSSNYSQTIKQTKPMESTLVENNLSTTNQSLLTLSNLQLPAINSALFRQTPSSNHHYIIETDPAFTNRKQWLSSDFMLQTLGTDPSVTQKRLGDGFYEQKLIREQIAQLTGQRFLQNYQDDEAQYTALMENAVTFAQQHQLRPGIALTPAQMAQLTSDIVWLVEQDVALDDGTTTKALVPQVYAMVNPGDLDGSGALFSANNLQLDLTDDLINSGTLLAKDTIQIHANNIEHTGEMKADSITAQAENDFTISGGNLNAQTNMTLMAGQNLNIESTLSQNENIVDATPEDTLSPLGKSKNTQNQNRYATTQIDRQASIFVGNGEGGQLNLVSGNQLNIKGANVESEGDLNLQAKNIDINTLETSDEYSLEFSNGYSKGNSITHHQTQLSANNISLKADQAVSITGSSVDASDNLNLTAQAVLIHSAHNSQSHESEFKDKGFLGQKEESQRQGQFSQAISSQLQSNNLQISTDTLQLVGSTIEAEIANIEAELIQLISDKDSTYENNFSDSSNLLTRTIETQGQHNETAVESAIQASKLIVNDQDTIKHTLDSDQLISRISSEHPELSNDQIELIQANLTNKEWDDKITTLSETGAIIVQAVVTYLTAGAGAGAGAALAEATNTALNATLQTAIDATIKTMIHEATNQAVTAALTGNYDFDLEGLATNALKSGVTAGMGQYSQELLVKHELTGLTGDSLNLAQKAATQTALYGGDFKENLTNTLIDDAAKSGANFIGDSTDAASFNNIVSHAVLGCGVADAKGQDCTSGAAGGAMSAALAPHIAKLVDDGDGKFTTQEKDKIRLLTLTASTLALSNTDIDLTTADQAAQNEVDNNTLLHLAALIYTAVDVYRADNGEQKIILERTCATGDTECSPRVELALADLKDHQILVGEDGTPNRFNHGINNDKEQALQKAKQQHGEEALKDGIYTVINPKTSNFFSETVYAGLDKTREVLGKYNFLGISNASKTNIAFEEKVAQMNKEKLGEVKISIDDKAHSRGTLTHSNALTAQWQQGATNVPISSITYNGAAANAERVKNVLNNINDKNQIAIHQSTHKNDWIGRLIGGNESTGGEEGTGFLKAHTTYGPSANRDQADTAWGTGNTSITIQINSTTQNQE